MEFLKLRMLVATWNKKVSNWWIDMEFKPGDRHMIYGSNYLGMISVYMRSDDNGENWITIFYR